MDAPMLHGAWNRRHKRDSPTRGNYLTGACAPAALVQQGRVPQDATTCAQLPARIAEQASS
eukprot:1162223-Amphidinium_carterae.1